MHKVPQFWGYLRKISRFPNVHFYVLKNKSVFSVIEKKDGETMKYISTIRANTQKSNNVSTTENVIFFQIYSG